MARNGVKPISPLVRVWWHTQAMPNGCIEYTAKRDRSGYGLVPIPVPGNRQRRLKAHRLAWESANGPIPDGLWVLHHCDNPPCVNPDHLYLGGRLENAADMTSRGRHPNQRKETCPQGHVYDRIDDKGHRWCRTCHREACRRYEAKKRESA